MSNKIYVGNLPYRLAKNELAAFFEGCGAIDEVHIAMDRQTGNSKGFGFVTFTSAGSAEQALKLNGSELKGRALRIDLARENPAGGGAAGGFRSREGGSGGYRGGDRDGGFRSDRGDGGGYRGGDRGDRS